MKLPKLFTKLNPLNWFTSPGPQYSLPAASDTGSRTVITHSVVTQKTEVQPWERKRAVEKSSWADGSLGFFSALIRRSARYMTPITPVPMTGNPVYDKQLRDEWRAWSTNPQRCDFNKRQSYRRICGTMIMSLIRQGEVFQQQVPNADGGPRIKLIDDRMVAGTPAVVRSGYVWVDGVEFSPEDEITGYCVKNVAGELVRVDAAEVNHVLDVVRINQPRGLPFLTTGLNCAIDIADLVALEKAAAKLHAAIAVAVTKKSGEAEDGLSGVLKQQLAAAAAEAAASEGTEVAPEIKSALETIEGVMVKYLQPDEDVKLLSSQRPSAAFAGFIDFLIRDVAWSMGVPPEFAWNASKLNGNNMRFVMMDTQSFFDYVIEIMVDGTVRPTYLAVIGAAIAAGRVPNLPGWDKVEFQGPPKLTIDVKNDTASDLIRLQNGMMTYDEYFAARNKDAREERTKGIQWCKETIEECAKAGVPLGFYIRSIGGVNNNSPELVGSDASDSSDEDLGSETAFAGV